MGMFIANIDPFPLNAFSDILDLDPQLAVSSLIGEGSLLCVRRYFLAVLF